MTIANKIKDHFETMGIKKKIFSEGDSLETWHGMLIYQEMNTGTLLKNNPQHVNVIQKHTQLEEDYALVAYTKLGVNQYENELMKYFETHEVYDGRVCLDIFKKALF